jgi:AAA domain
MGNGPLPQEIWDQDLAALSQTSTDWLWHGFLAGGSQTLLTGLWKAGKTTLLSLLLARRKDGGTLAGRAVKPGKTVVISEESPARWAERRALYDFGGNVCFFPQPFLTVPSLEQWRCLLERVLQLREQHGIDLLVIDPLAPFLRSENNARNIFDTFMPLSALTRRGMAVLANHHPSRGDRPLGQSARGSGALLGHVDVTIEMRHPGGDPLTRRRRLLSLSRHAETPRQLLIELNADATDYVVLPDDDYEDSFEAGWHALTLIFEDAPQKLTRQDVLGEWPPDFDKPSLSTLRGWLDRAVDRALLACEGTGRKGDPLRYWFPQREAVWKEHFLYDILEEQRLKLNLPFESLTQRKRSMAESDDFLRRPHFEPDDEDEDR